MEREREGYEYRQRAALLKAARRGYVPRARPIPGDHNFVPTRRKPVSLFNRVTVRTINPAGWPVDFELKEGQHPREAIAWLMEHGYQPAPAGPGTAAPVPAASPVPAAVNGNGHAAPPPAAAPVPVASVDPTPAPAMTGEITFTAGTLAATVDKGKTYWKIMGGQYQTYGVTVWPEVLTAAGFDPAALNPLQTYDLTGWTAVCSVKANGQPRKVTALTR